MGRHRRRRLLLLLAAALFALVAGAIAINVQSAVSQADSDHPGTDAAGMLGMSMVVTSAMAAGVAVALAVLAARVRPRRRWLPPPGWPPAPPGWEPPDGWVPDFSWPRAPSDWEWWDEDA